jgi:hypothetical protein
MLKHSNNIIIEKLITDATGDEESAVRVESFTFK